MNNDYNLVGSLIEGTSDRVQFGAYSSVPFNFSRFSWLANRPSLTVNEVLNEVSEFHKKAIDLGAKIREEGDFGYSDGVRIFCESDYARRHLGDEKDVLNLDVLDGSLSVLTHPQVLKFHNLRVDARYGAVELDSFPSMEQINGKPWEIGTGRINVYFSGLKMLELVRDFYKATRMD